MTLLRTRLGEPLVANIVKKSGTMALTRKFLATDLESLTDKRQVRVVISTGDMDSEGEIIVQDGIDCSWFAKNGTILFGHDWDQPIAKPMEIGLVQGKLMGIAQFPPEGVSKRADEIYGLIGAGVINNLSIGIMPLNMVPMEASNPKGPQKYLTSELMEFSFVSVPANQGASVIERTPEVKPLPVLTGNSPVPVNKLASAIKAKGLSGVSNLAYLLDELGWVQSSAQWEADIEGDGSTVPAQLGAAMMQLGEVLVAMTREEVAELMAGLKMDTVEADDLLGDGASASDAAFVKSAKSPLIAKMRARFVKDKRAAILKAGRSISAGKTKILQEHVDCIKSAMETIKSGMKPVEDMLAAANADPGTTSTTDVAGQTPETGADALASPDLDVNGEKSGSPTSPSPEQIARIKALAAANAPKT